MEPSSSPPPTASQPESYQLLKAGILLGILLPIVALVLVSIVMLMSAGIVARLRRRRKRSLKKKMLQRLQDLMEIVTGLEGRLKVKRDQEKEKTDRDDDRSSVTEDASRKEY